MPSLRLGSFCATREKSSREKAIFALALLFSWSWTNLAFMSNICGGVIGQIPLLSKSNHNPSLQTSPSVELSRELSENRTVVNQIYLDDTDLDSEEAPLFPPASTGRRHQFEDNECSSYFPRESVLKELFAKKSNILRFKLYVAWWVIIHYIMQYERFISYWCNGKYQKWIFKRIGGQCKHYAQLMLASLTCYAIQIFHIFLLGKVLKENNSYSLPSRSLSMNMMLVPNWLTIR